MKKKILVEENCGLENRLVKEELPPEKYRFC